MGALAAALDARRLVAAGSDRLDDLGPFDWPFRVDLDVLDLDSPRWCVLGQVYGRPGEVGGDFADFAAFGRAVEALDIDEPSNYGFDAGNPTDRAALEAQWRHVITERRKPVPS